MSIYRLEKYILNINFGAVHEIFLLIVSASIEGSGESAHIRRLVRAFAARINKEGV